MECIAATLNLPYLEDIPRDEIVHVVESPLALEEAVWRVHVLRPILVPEVRDGHSKIPCAG